MSPRAVMGQACGWEKSFWPLGEAHASGSSTVSECFYHHGKRETICTEKSSCLEGSHQATVPLLTKCKGQQLERLIELLALSSLCPWHAEGPRFNSQCLHFKAVKLLEWGKVFLGPWKVVRGASQPNWLGMKANNMSNGLKGNEALEDLWGYCCCTQRALTSIIDTSRFLKGSQREADESHC